MAVNRHRNHLTIYLEDRPYRELVNGAKNLMHINEQVIDDKNPCGGWTKVFAQLEENLNLLNAKIYMHALLLMDFDNQFAARKEKFEEILIEQPCRDRVFLLGIDNKESESLKRTLGITNNEKISEILLEKCPDEIVEIWQNEHLRCNTEEIERMRNQSVFEWLFVKR